MTEPQVWTLIAVFGTAMFAMLGVVSGLFTRVLRAEIGGVHYRLDGMDRRLDGIDDRMDRFERHLSNLDRDVQALTRRVFPD